MLGVESDRELFLLGSNHKIAPLDIREKLAITNKKMGKLYDDLMHNSPVLEGVVLNTCNRVELYGISASGDIQDYIEDYFCKLHDSPLSKIKDYLFWKTNNDAIDHLFSVASGVESQIIGETEILGQVKKSYQQAFDSSFTGPYLNTLFQKSFQAAKWARTNTEISKGQISIGNVAVNLANRIYGDLKDSRVLIIGTGEVACNILQALQSRGSGSVTVTGRTSANADALAEKVNGKTIPFESLQSEIENFDIVLSSTSSNNEILMKADVALALKNRPFLPFFMIDLAVPRDIDDSVSDLENVYLYNMDDLSKMANENLKNREIEIVKCQAGLKKKSEYLWTKLSNELKTY